MHQTQVTANQPLELQHIQQKDAALRKSLAPVFAKAAAPTAAAGEEAQPSAETPIDDPLEAFLQDHPQAIAVSKHDSLTITRAQRLTFALLLSIASA